MATTKLEEFQYTLDNLDTIRLGGKVKQVIGLTIESDGPPAQLGEVCKIRLSNTKSIFTEVVGFRDRQVLLMPLGEMDGIAADCEVIATGKPLLVPVSEQLKGRVLDGLGRPIDGKPPCRYDDFYPILNSPPDPLRRPRIKNPLPLGIKTIDALLTVGKGQRFGIFSGSGVGKSTLMGMIARFTKAEVNVIALIGERGREVRDFIERDLQDEGLARSVVVVATSDEAPLIRLRGAFVATAIAEYFRDKGYDVMFMMDSITRFARAQREVGLSIGEPPTTRGFTPSVFAILPKLLERSGTSEKGTITGLYTILVDADDMNEPIADNVRAILDGHVVLSRDLAARNHYPAIDVLQSVSRVMLDIVPAEHDNAARRLKEIVATIRDAQDLIDIGAYVKGSNPKIDYALSMIDEVTEFLKQGIFEKVDYQTAVSQLMKLFVGKEGTQG
ncbi:MAG: flagellar protein export ATPase FliI [Nitrospirota bacterium]